MPLEKNIIISTYFSENHLTEEINGYKFIIDTAGQLTMVFYYAGIYTNILITINRCFVITWPVLYQKYFNTTMTIRWIAIIWSIAFTQSCIYQFRKWFFTALFPLIVWAEENNSRKIYGRFIFHFYMRPFFQSYSITHISMFLRFKNLLLLKIALWK